MDHGLKWSKLKLNKDGTKDAIQTKTRKKNIGLKVKASNSPISRCINYTRGCSIIHLQSNVTNRDHYFWVPRIHYFAWQIVYTHSNGIMGNHLVSPGDQGPLCVDGIVFQPLQLNHTGVSSSCSWILTHKCSCVIMFEHVYFMCVWGMCCAQVFEHLYAPRPPYSYSSSLCFLST